MVKAHDMRNFCFKLSTCFQYLIILEFIEDFLFGNLSSNEIRVLIEGIGRDLDNVETKNLLSSCNGRFISFSFDNSIYATDFSGRKMTITLINVIDLKGNVI